MIQRLLRRSQSVKTPRPTSIMEKAPQLAIYALHPAYTIYLILRYRGVMLPTIANPGLEASGLMNESKKGLFDVLGPVGRNHFAPFVTIKTGPDATTDAVKVMRENKLGFPIVAKPDIGRRGFGVKVVHDEAELSAHLNRFRPGLTMMLQDFIEGPGEAGLFFVRMPTEKRGRILSLTIKHFPEVVGDGVHTLRELILRDPRARDFTKVYFKRHQTNLETVIPDGERFRLVSVGNHVRGAAFEDGSAHITPALNHIINTIVDEVPGFYIGRFDVRYKTLADLKRGSGGFSIVEYNGAGGEPTHIWDPRTSIAATYRGLLEHWTYLFAIGAENRKRGAKPMTPLQVIKYYLDERDLLKGYPDQE